MLPGLVAALLISAPALAMSERNKAALPLAECPLAAPEPAFAFIANAKKDPEPERFTKLQRSRDKELFARSSAAMEQFDAAAAEVADRERLKLFEEVYGPDSPALTSPLTGLTVSVQTQGRYQEAETFIRRAIALRPSSLSIPDEIAWGLSWALGLNLDLQGRYAEAEPYMRQSLALAVKLFGQIDAKTSTNYNGFGLNLRYQDRLGEAADAYSCAIAIRRVVFGEMHLLTAESYSNYGMLQVAEDNYDVAEPYLRRALEILRKTRGENDPLTARAYGNLGLIEDARGNDKDAETFLRRSLDTYRRIHGDNHPDTAIAYRNLGDLLDEDRQEEALVLLEHALAANIAALGEEHPDTAATYVSLGRKYLHTGQSDKAETMFRKALSANQSRLGEISSEVATNHVDLANVLHQQERYDEATIERKQALAVTLKIFGEENAEVPALFQDWALTELARGNLDEARVLSNHAIDLARKWRTSVGETSINSDEILRTIRIDGRPSNEFDIQLKQNVLVNWLASFHTDDHADKLRFMAVALESAQELETSPTGRAMALEIAREAVGDPQLGALVRQQQDASREALQWDRRLDAALRANPDADVSRLWSGRTAALNELVAINEKVRRDLPRYADLVAPLPMSAGEIQKRLGDKDALLFIAPVHHTIVTFIVTKRGGGWQVNQASQSIISRLDSLLCSIETAACRADASASSKSGVFDRDAAFEIYTRLIGPLDEALNGVDRLYVTVVGPLGRLPLGVLLTKAPTPKTPDAWLSDRYSIVVLPSVSGLQPSSASPPALRTDRLAFVGYGAPDLIGPAKGPSEDIRRGNRSDLDLANPNDLRRHFAPLPKTRAELEGIARTLGATNASLRLGPAATERALRADVDLSNAAVVAIATHAISPTSTRPEPGLVLTPPSKASANDDGVLTASEVIRLKLRADWIVLSACDTANAGPEGSDTITTLAQAFLYAGAKSLLASYWRVDDRATAALIVEVFEILKADPFLSNSQALQQAMRRIRTGVRPDGSTIEGWDKSWEHPRFWAPFSFIANQDRPRNPKSPAKDQREAVTSVRSAETQ